MKDKNKNIVFTSMHLSRNRKNRITNHNDYWKKYIVYTKLARACDTSILDFFKKQRISSYVLL